MRSGSGAAGLGRGRDLDQLSGADVVQEAVDRDTARNQRMIANPGDIVDDGLRSVGDRQPVDI